MKVKVFGFFPNDGTPTPSEGAEIRKMKRVAKAITQSSALLLTAEPS